MRSDLLLLCSGSADFQDGVNFLLQNFSEMNRLWIRLQHQMHTKDKKKIEKERQELCILVGTGLVRLSQLDGITFSYYKEVSFAFP